MSFQEEPEVEKHNLRLGKCIPVISGSVCQFLMQRICAGIDLQFVPNGGLVRIPDCTRLGRLIFQGSGIQLSRVLETYKLTIRAKIRLAHIISRALWQFYGSELSRDKWTSDNIWLMQEAGHDKPKDRLPLQVYISPDLGQHGKGLPEILDNGYFHRRPHILALGILLLEIGLGRPITRILFDKLHTEVHTELENGFKCRFGDWFQLSNFVIHSAVSLDVASACLDARRT